MDVFQRAISLEAKYGDARYNLACAYSLAGDFSNCLEELEQVRLLDGFVGEVDPLSDPDLANIRSDPEYGPKLRALVGP